MDVERRIAQQLMALRMDRAWSLEVLAERSGISRSTLSRLERSELSPTAAMLGKLCSVYGWTLSRLMAEVETQGPSLLRRAQQPEWTDPETGFHRRAVSMPSAGLRAEMIEGRMPTGASISYEAAPVPGLEHHLYLLEGALTMEIEGSEYRLEPGDCLRYVLVGSSRFSNSADVEARYVIAMVRP
jgi:transcriptional regulator with XRE-family HTH domain